MLLCRLGWQLYLPLYPIDVAPPFCATYFIKKIYIYNKIESKNIKREIRLKQIGANYYKAFMIDVVFYS